MDREASTTLAARLCRVRDTSVRLCATLAPEDTVVQSMPDVSPSKWHLAHVTWFFERFVLEAFMPGYRRLNDDYDFLFNSYYHSVGSMHARPQRGLLSRPGFADVLAYRQHVDAALQELLAEHDQQELIERVVLGINHEQQHQELLLTDIKHVFSQNPLAPAVNAELRTPPAVTAREMEFVAGRSGIVKVGASGTRFCFDNELPRHDALLHPHEIGNRLVTNGEYREFIVAGGYADSTFWLSDGWTCINERGWNRPLYWSEDLQSEFTLAGKRDLDLQAPVCHVSYYEAEAFARWAGARLPTEFEWENAADGCGVAGNLLDSGYWQPVAAADDAQYFGDVWEWTASAYLPYPGFEPLPGSLGEYNGKFMCNQMSVRGGSCVSSADHLRASYRSFFYPDARWQFLGIRLARDLKA
jgi:ergothioneine biosynthesis protein EgtB